MAVEWVVSAADCRLANCTAIAKYLNKKYPQTNSFITVPNHLFKSVNDVGSYLISLKLTNLFMRSSIGSVSVRLAQGQAGPQLTIASPPIINQYRWQDLILSASISQPSCGANSSQPLSFAWAVYQGLSYLPGLKTTSVDPRTFRMPAYSLDTGTSYTIKVTVAVGMTQ